MTIGSRRIIHLVGDEAEFTRHTSPEVRLCRHIILTAALDAVWGNPGGDRRFDKQVRASALRWFTDAGDDFEMICACADFEPVDVRTSALRYIRECLANPDLSDRRPAVHEHAVYDRKAA